MSGRDVAAASVLGAAGGAGLTALLTKKPPAPGSEPVDLNTITDLLTQINNNLIAFNEMFSQTEETSQLTVQGYPNNATGLEIVRLDIAALNTAYQFPDVEVPNGFQVLFKAWPTNAGIIYLGKTGPDARNVVQVCPMLPNDVVTLAIKNSKMVFITGTAVGDFMTMMVESRGG